MASPREFTFDGEALRTRSLLLASATQTTWVDFFERLRAEGFTTSQGSLRGRYRPSRTSRILPDMILTLVHSTRLLPWVVKIMSVPRSVSRATVSPYARHQLKAHWNRTKGQEIAEPAIDALTTMNRPVPFVPYVPFRWQALHVVARKRKQQRNN